MRVVAALVGIAVVVAGCSSSQAPSQTGGDLPLRKVGEMALTGGPVRFDYTGFDAGRGLLFLAHMGAGEVVEVDVHARTVVRTRPDTPDVHGVIVVADKRRVYATATGRDQLVAFDEDNGAVLFTAPTGTYPDGLAYDPVRNAVWTTNEHAGTETVVDADAGSVRATVPLGGEVGNVVYDSAIDRMVVAVQGRGDLALIDPETFAVTDRISTPGCDAPHGQALDNAAQLMFVGCEGNATMVTVDLAARSVIDRHSVGETPDVLVYDAGAQRVYVACESGWVSVFDLRDRRTTAAGAKHLADGAHTLALDPATHHSYFPIPDGGANSPVLWEFEPTT
ncbi:YncE family protein [Nocardia sp. NPDC050408]|uniref:YncE family protein n=1 Tax=Nocardia sp. NPDC050408 TaxID=3364319 RepID=UPI00378DDB05